MEIPWNSLCHIVRNFTVNLAGLLAKARFKETRLRYVDEMIHLSERFIRDLTHGLEWGRWPDSKK